MLKASGHTNQTLADARRLALVFRELAVRGTGRMREQRFGVAQVGTQRQHTQAVEYMERTRAGRLWIAGFHIKRQHRATHA